MQNLSSFPRCAESQCILTRSQITPMHIQVETTALEDASGVISIKSSTGSFTTSYSRLFFASDLGRQIICLVIIAVFLNECFNYKQTIVILTDKAEEGPQICPLKSVPLQPQGEENVITEQ